MEIVEKNKLTRRVLVEKYTLINIGDVVNITNSGFHYSTYNVKFHEMEFREPTKRHYFTYGLYGEYVDRKLLEFEVFSRSLHDITGELICGIEDKEGNQFLFAAHALRYYR